MRVGCCHPQKLASGSSTFVGARPFHAVGASTQPATSRPQLQVYAKGKQAMRRGGNRQNSGVMQPDIPVPPVDPENVEFVIFVRSKKLPQWMPLSVMKGGGPANLLVKSLENDLGKKLYGKTLVDNVGRAIYKDRADVERTIRAQFPMFKAAKEFEYGFKIRDKENPKAWYQVTPDLQVIPPEAELGTGVLDEVATGVKETTTKVTDFLNNLGKGFGAQKQ